MGSSGSVVRVQRVMAEVCREKLPLLGWDFVAETDVLQFSISRSSEVTYELGFGLDRVTTLGLFPTIGVRHREASELRCTLSGVPVGRLCAFGRALADLMSADGVPDPHRRWRAVTLDDVDVATDRLRDDVHVYAMPFLEPYQTLADVIVGLEQQRRTQPQSGYLAIARALAGDVPAGLVALAEYAEPPQRIFPATSPQFRGFLRRFADHFGLDEASLPEAVRQYV